MTANYFGMISLIDHNVGRIILELKRLVWIKILLLSIQLIMEIF